MSACQHGRDVTYDPCGYCDATGRDLSRIADALERIAMALEARPITITTPEPVIWPGYTWSGSTIDQSGATDR